MVIKPPDPFSVTIVYDSLWYHSIGHICFVDADRSVILLVPKDAIDGFEAPFLFPGWRLHSGLLTALKLHCFDIELYVMVAADNIAVVTVHYDPVPDNNWVTATLGHDAFFKLRVLAPGYGRGYLFELFIHIQSELHWFPPASQPALRILSRSFSAVGTPEPHCPRTPPLAPCRNSHPSSGTWRQGHG